MNILHLLHLLREHFQLIFDNSNVNNEKQIKQKMMNFLFFANFSQLSNFSSSEATLDSKVAPTKGISLAFQLHTSKTFSNAELFSKINTMLLKQSAILFTSCQKNIAYMYYVSEHLKHF